MTAPLRGWLTTILALLTAVALVAPAERAWAEPNETPNETETPLLRDVIESTNRGYIQAKAKLDQSKRRQQALNLELQKAQERLDLLAPQVAQIAAQSYRQGKIGAIAVLLESDSPDSFVERASRLDELNRLNDRKLRELTEARDIAERAKAQLDAEILEQNKQLTIMTKQKKEAEKALALVGGMSLTKGFVTATSPVAKAAPRTASGDWPSESCNQDDPTTSGCITPRTMHMYKEVKKAGFNRFVGCYRSGGPYEHPKGRACDWSLINRGFVSAQNQDQRMYGNNLTAFLVRNADRLGIYYVIWYKQIWMPATGWSSYSGASDHTDHVHVSML
ncbi:hypothetical protein GCM10027280_11250 [Micromonospora polyrhachis]|uniref:ARB-07466-like C-terminal domain-containing protein n=1 Tax=Micromonospora polyrhachis TaxID=1282883 RepID=A0A7W7SSR5_9ACTN|nr:hypothetical protein [Micromonospora polyrhachis]MBB4959861.1 hypothetical protein [Micromonospora polyrhachis]